MKERLLLHWHCSRILKKRKKLAQLIEKGHALSSKKVVGIGNQITTHCLKAGLFTLSQNHPLGYGKQDSKPTPALKA